MTQDITRRAALVGSAAIGVDLLPYARPVRAAPQADAALLALREPYEQTLRHMDAMSAPHDAAETRFFAIRNASPDRDRRSMRKEAGLVTADRNYYRALRANTAVVETIANTAARTSEGLAFKARVSKRESNTNLALLGSIVDDILRIGEV